MTAPVSSWTERAACRGRTDEMFPTPTGWLTANRAHIDPARYDEALAICTGCPVLDDCRRLLAEDPHLWSSEAVIAGTTPLERLAMPDPWGREPEPDACGELRGTISGRNRHRTAGERTCVDCRAAAAAYTRAYRARRREETA